MYKSQVVYLFYIFILYVSLYESLEGPQLKKENIFISLLREN